MKKNSLYIVICYTIVIALILAGFFLLDVNQIIIHFWALTFLILSLVVSMGLLVTIAQQNSDDKEPVFYNAGVTAVICCYQVAVIISVALVGMFNEKLAKFVFVEISIIAVFAIILIAVNSFPQHTRLSNEKTLEQRENNEFDKPKRGGL